MKTFKKVLANQAGMSLIEVIVAAAISVIISGAVMKTNQMGVQGAKTVESNVSLSLWKANVLSRELDNPATCLANFGSSDIQANENMSVVNDGQGQPLLQVDTTIPETGGDWKVAANAAPVNYAIVRTAFKPNGSAATATRGRCDLEVWVSRTKNGFGGQTKKLTIPMACTIPSPGSSTMLSCSIAAGSQDTLWQHYPVSGAKPEHILRNSNVLIGEDTAAASDDPYASFQINLTSGIEWPSTGQGIDPLLKITGTNKAMIFTKSALYEDSNGCMVTSLDDTGLATTMRRDCLSALELGSTYATVTPATNGQTNVAIASRRIQVGGENSAAIASDGAAGFESVANGNSAVVLGASNVQVTGARSVGMGEDNIVSGQNALVAGYNNTVSGRGSLSLGYNNIISGNNSFAAGYNNTVSGTGSVALGYNGTVSGNQSLAGGTSSAKGWASFAFGQESVAQGSKSVVMGWGSEANGSNSKVFADHADVDGNYSIAMGYDLTVNGGSSMVLGFGGSSTNRVIENQSHHFTAMFDNGYVFKTDRYNQNDKTDNVYISGEGQLLIGNDVSHPDDYRTNFQVFNKLDNTQYSLRTNRTSTWMADGRIIAWGGGDMNWTGYDSYDDNWQSVGVGLVPTRGDSATWPMEYLSTFGINMGYSDGDARWRISSDGASNGSAGLVMNYGPGWLGLYVKGSNGGWGHLVDSTELQGYIRVKVEDDIVTFTEPAVGPGFTVPSDKRIKENFSPIENSLEKLKALNGYHYQYKKFSDLDKDLQANNMLRRKSGEKDIGLVAQEVEKVFPELVKTDKNEGKVKTVNYSQMVAVVIEAVKELADKVADNVKEIMGLNDKVDHLERRVSSLEEENRLMREQLCELHPELKSCLKQK